MTRSTLTPQIYVANLRAYNEGKQEGEWIDISWVTDKDEILEEIKNVVGEDEWAIHTSEDLGIISEHPDLDKLAEMCPMIEEHGQAFIAWKDYYGGTIQFSEYENLYYGTFEGCTKSEAMREFAHEYVDSHHFDTHINDIPLGESNLTDYLDFERIANDITVNLFNAFWVDRKLYVFRNR